jgi:hypothetical protein
MLPNPAASKRSIASVADASTDDDAVVFVAVETGTVEEEDKGEKCDFIFSGLLNALRKLSLYVRQDTLSFRLRSGRQRSSIVTHWAPPPAQKHTPTVPLPQ